MREFVKTMKGLSDPNRVKIIKLLQRRALCVCHITKALGLAQSTTSKHLKILLEADMIARTKDGLWVRYRLGDVPSNRYAASMLGNLKHWLENDPEVAAMMAQLCEDRQEKQRFDSQTKPTMADRKNAKMPDGMGAAHPLYLV